MRATGIVRRIDDLGRVVIPKEIRRTMHIREGDPLEIFTGPDGDVIFRKYSPVEELGAFASGCAEVLAKVSGTPALVCDRDRVVAVSGMPFGSVKDRRLADDMEQIMSARRICISDDRARISVAADDGELFAKVAVPIVASGDVMGCIALVTRGGDTPPRPTEAEVKLAAAAAGFIGKQTES